jgi:Spy/CpxP family protein refolding chaperone
MHFHFPISRCSGRLVPALLLLVPALLLMLAATPAAAGPGHGPDGFGGPPLGAMLDFQAEELGLDEDTRQAIREIVESSHARDEELRNQIRTERRTLRELMEREPVDRDAVMDQVERVSELEADEDKHRIDTMLRIREQLTPEQRAALVESRQRMHERHLGPILEACQEERVATCQPQGGPRAIHCLLRHRAELSQACSSALDSLPPHFAKGGCGWGKGGWHDPPHGADPLGPPPGPDGGSE